MPDELSDDDRARLVKVRYRELFDECMNESFGELFDKRINELAELAKGKPGQQQSAPQSQERPQKVQRRSLLDMCMSQSLGIGGR